MLKKLKKKLRKLYRRFDSRYSAKKETGSTGKKLSEATEKHIENIMRKSGWGRNETLKRIKEAKKSIGISFADFDRYDFHKVPVSEQTAEYSRILAAKEKPLPPATEKRIQSIMKKSGWSREQTLKTVREAKKTIGISFTDFDRYDFYAIPEKKRAEAYKKLVVKQDKKADAQAKHRRAELTAAGAVRPAAELTPALPRLPDTEFEEKNRHLRYREPESDWGPQNMADDKQPAPIIAACYFLGIPLPEYATCAYQPSAYVTPIGGSFEAIAARLGSDILQDTELTRTAYDFFRRRFKAFGALDHNDTDLAIYFTDFMLFCADYGYEYEDYFDFQFYNKEIEIRNTYLGKSYIYYIERTCNTSSGTFKDKGKFNAYFKGFVNRDWIDSNTCSYSEFESFIKRHDRFFAKPNKGKCGVGIGIIESSSMEPLELYEFCREQGFVMEEVLVQHPDMARMNSDTVNTVRVYTLTGADGRARIMSAMCRFGRVGSCVDNYHAGGVAALVDLETGMIRTNAIDRAGNRCVAHPDSGIVFKGFQIPEWNKIVKTVKAVAEKASDFNRHAGWDVSIRQNGDIEIIEGNSRPGFGAIQSIDKMGKRYRYEQSMNELAEKLGKPLYRFGDPHIDISGMELKESECRAVKKSSKTKAAAKHVTGAVKLSEVVPGEGTDWLRALEIKGPDYDPVNREYVGMSDVRYKPARYKKEGGFWRSDAPDKSSVRIMFTGDLTCFDGQFEEAKCGRDYDFGFEFDAVRDIFAQTDLMVGNLETMIAPSAPYRTEKFVSEQNFSCNAPCEFLDALRCAGFDLVTNANNHDLDTGAVGIAETIENVERFGLIQTGTFRTNKKHYELLDVCGFKIAIIAFGTDYNRKLRNLTHEGQSFLLNVYSYELADRLIGSARSDGAELVFVCIHWGKEYKFVQNDEQENICRELIGLGCDCIIGSHPHVLEPFEIKRTEEKDVPVFWSLGNFISHNTDNSRARSAIACVDISRPGGRLMLSCSYIPVFTSASYKGRRFVELPIPENASDRKNRRLLERISFELGDVLEQDKRTVFGEYVEDKLPPAPEKPAEPRLPSASQPPVMYDNGRFIFRVYHDHAIVAGLSRIENVTVCSIPGSILGVKVTGMDEGAFSGYNSVRKINFSRGTADVPPRACMNCKGLEGLQISRSNTVIGERAFYGCTSLYFISARPHTRRIESEAFAGCTELRSVMLTDSVEFIADNAFDGCSKAVFYCSVGSYGEKYAASHGFKSVNMYID